MAHDADPAYKRLSPKEWLEICSLACDGIKPPKIAEIYSVHHSVIYRGLAKRSIKVGSAIEDARREAEEKSRADLINRIKATKDDDYKFTEFLQKRIIKVMMEATNNTEKRPADVLDDMKALKIAIDAIRSGTANKWLILGLDRENAGMDEALPELPIREMTDTEVEAMRDRQELEDGIDPTELGEDSDLPDDLDGENLIETT